MPSFGFSQAQTTLNQFQRTGQAQALIAGARVSQEAIEILDSSTILNAVVSQEAIETLDNSTILKAVVSQEAIEVLFQPVRVGLGQTQTKIIAFGVNRFAQAQAQINSFGVQDFAQAQARITAHVPSFAQVQADILATSNNFAQSQVNTKSTSYVFAQAQCLILTANQFAQAQTDIKVTSRGFGQSQADILVTTNRFSQAQAQIGHIQNAQAQASILATSTRAAQAKTDIKAVSYVFSQARVQIGGGSNLAQAQADIKQTYPIFSENINYALLSMGATSSNSLGSPDTDRTIDGQDYGPAWIMLTALNQNLFIDLGQFRTINYFRILPLSYDCTVSLQYNTDSVGPGDGSWHNIVTGIQFSSSIFDDVDTSKVVAGEIPPTTMRYWRLLVTDGGTYNAISISTLELGIASVKSGTFAQAQVFIGHFGVSQAQSYVSPGLGIAFGQANSDIVETLQKFGQTQVFIIKAQGYAQAQSDTLQTQFKFGQANAWVIPPTVVGQAQAKINSFGVNSFGQARIRVKTTNLKFAQAKVFIHKFAGFGQATAQIKTSRSWKFGQARVTIGHFSYGQAQAYIHKSVGFAQADVDIRRVFQKYGQTQALIKKSTPNAQAQAVITQTYQQYAQAQAILNQTFGLAQAQADIVATYSSVAQAKVRIKQTYRPVAQTNADIRVRHWASVQAQAFIHYGRLNGYGQTQAQIGGFNYGQAQARIIASKVGRTGLAQVYIIPSSGPIFIPSSDVPTYLVRFNNYTLPGYAQSETYSSEITITDKYAIYINKSLSEDIGLTNKVVTIKMRLWETSYIKCKNRAAEAFTMLRSAKGKFAKLYIQRYDRYYTAMVKNITVDKTVGTSVKILDYTIEFECLPWLIGNPTIPTSPPVPGINVVQTANTNSRITNATVVKSGQARASISKSTAFSQAQTRIQGTTLRVGRAQAFIKKAVGLGQANVSILGSSLKIGQAQTSIRKLDGVAQAQAQIKKSKISKFGQARVKISKSQTYGQAQALIVVLPGAPFLTDTPGDTSVSLIWSS